MIEIKYFTFNPFSENTYVLHDIVSLEAVIIDPGCYDKDEQDQLVRYISSKKLKVTKLLNTHGHIDHVLGNDFVKRKFGIELYIGAEDEATLRSVAAYAPVYGFANYTPAEPDYFISEADTIKLGDLILEIIFVPGHAPGHIAFYNKEQKFIINGDCLFQGSIGRTDLPGGNFETLVDSIKNNYTRFPTIPWSIAVMDRKRL